MDDLSLMLEDSEVAGVGHPVAIEGERIMLLDVLCCCMYIVINDRGGLVLNSGTRVGYLYLCMCGGCVELSSSRPMRLRIRRLVEDCVYWIVGLYDPK